MTAEATDRIDKALAADSLFAPVVIPAELQRQFKAHDAERQRRLLEIALIVGVSLYMSFPLVDWFVARDVFWVGLFTRGLIVFPIGMFTLYHLHNARTSLFVKQIMTAAFSLVMTIFFVGITALSHAPPAQVYITGGNTVMVFVVSMMSIPFSLAVIVALLTIAIQAAGVVFSPFASLSLFMVVVSIGLSTAAPSLYANWCLQNERRRHFLTTKRDELRLRTIAEQRDQLNRLATVDPLTGISNRRGLDSALEQALEQTGAHASIAVAMIDIDFFKPFNDNYGHPAGDKALQRVAAALSRAGGDTALIARMGGEEFAIAWVDVTGHALHTKGEHLRNSVVDLRIDHAYNDALDGLTVSIGMSHGQIGPDTLATVFARADEALYEAKSAGRNRVVVHASDAPRAIRPRRASSG